MLFVSDISRDLGVLLMLWKKRKYLAVIFGVCKNKMEQLQSLFSPLNQTYLAYK